MEVLELLVVDHWATMEMGFLLAYLVAQAYLRRVTLCASWEGKHNWCLIGECCNRGELLVGTGGGLLSRHKWWLSDMRKFIYNFFCCVHFVINSIL